MNCKKCNQELNDSNKVKNKEMALGFLNSCKPCVNLYKKTRTALKPTQAAMTHKMCKVCQKQFKHIRHSHQIFCNIECAKIDAEENKNYRECLTCKNTFFYISPKNIYCSDLCSNIYRSKKRIDSRILTCCICRKQQLNKYNTMSSKPSNKGYACSDQCLIELHIEKNKQTGCWIWNGFINKDGIAKIVFKKTEFMARRFSYETFIGKIEKDEIFITTCKEKLCINPIHIQKIENRSLLLRKYIAKEEEIYSFYFKNNWTKRDISEKFNIPAPTIENILTRINSTKIHKEIKFLDSDEAMQQMLDEINKSLGD